MKKDRRKKRLAIVLMILVMAAAAALLGSRLYISHERQNGALRWDILASEGLLLAGGYGLAAAMGGDRKKRLRKDVSSHAR